ncbi:MoaD/ThiS family protein [Gramella sp. KN1008]|uniref:MoaD/ThiS family protein n=1 Tax=Gramella sp. KN1008 TaxID=2529298 RepID=UPI00103D1D51|nr:MoaD/ThiS family protein [Gramella sp. KN1008]TBW27153.1 MoaD/ThiS family protein [Gramella sp. KN1008]
MKIRLRYFGMIAESAGKNDEVLELNDGISAKELKARQIERFELPDPESVQIAVNQNLEEEVELKDGDEVAFLPPFAGG